MTRIMVLAFVGLLFAASCGSDDRILVFADDDAGAEVSVDSSDQFKIRLESNPSTGFAWQSDLRALRGVVELRSVSFEGPADTDLVGAPGNDVFVFEATAAGAGVLRFEYLQNSDDLPIPDRVLEYVVRVNGAPWPPDDTDPPSTSTASVPDGMAQVIEVSALFDGQGPREAIVAGFVIWDGGSARLCETIMESYPPQCGGMWVVIADPEHLTVELDEVQGVQWTPNRIDLAATFDGSQLIIDTSSDTTTPIDEG